MQICHQLREGDAERQVQYSQWLLGKPQSFMSQIIIGDEAIFQLNGNVSNHNVVRYAPSGDPPKDYVYDKPSSGEKLVVWIGLVTSNLIGSYFFDGNVNGQAYLEILKNFVLPEVENIFGGNQNGSTPRAHCFQDGVPGHRLNAVHDRLQTLFPNRILGILYLAFKIKCFRSTYHVKCVVNKCAWNKISHVLWLINPKSVESASEMSLLKPA